MRNPVEVAVLESVDDFPEIDPHLLQLIGSSPGQLNLLFNIYSFKSLSNSLPDSLRIPFLLIRLSKSPFFAYSIIK